MDEVVIERGARKGAWKRAFAAVHGPGACACVLRALFVCARQPPRREAVLLHLLEDRLGELDALCVGVRKELFNHAAPTAHHIFDRGKIALRDPAAHPGVPKEVAEVQRERVPRALSISYLHIPRAWCG